MIWMKHWGFRLSIAVGKSSVSEREKGCGELLDDLEKNFHLVLWTASNRSYADKALMYGLNTYFKETYSWDEIPKNWKDTRILNIDYLIDDSIYHKNIAAKHNIESRYIVVPAYGSEIDTENPRLWIDIIREVLYPEFCT